MACALYRRAAVHRSAPARHGWAGVKKGGAGLTPARASYLLRCCCRAPRALLAALPRLQRRLPSTAHFSTYTLALCPPPHAYLLAFVTVSLRAPGSLFPKRFNRRQRAFERRSLYHYPVYLLPVAFIRLAAKTFLAGAFCGWRVHCVCAGGMLSPARFACVGRLLRAAFVALLRRSTYL